MNILFITKTKLNSYGTAQMRILQPKEYLEKTHTVKVKRWIHLLPLYADVVVFHRIPLNYFSQLIFNYYTRNKSIIIFDTDDLVFNVQSDNIQSSDSYLIMAERCDIVTVSTEYLAQIIKEKINVDAKIVHNGLSVNFIKSAERVRNNRKNKDFTSITIGYCSGSFHHDKDLSVFVPSLVRIMEKYAHVRFYLIGKIKLPESLKKFKDRIFYKDFVPYNEFPGVYQSIDINVVPLDMSHEFSLGRSELKYIEAGACGVPTLASPIPAYLNAVEDGYNGWLATDEEWYDKLVEIIENPEIINKIGSEAYRDVVATYSPDVKIREWHHFLNELYQLRREKGKKMFLINFPSWLLLQTVIKIRYWSRLLRRKMLQKAKNF